MAVFLIALTEPAPDLEVKLTSIFPAMSHIKITDTLYMVKPDVASVHALRSVLGISTDDDAPSGMVIKISNDNTTGILPAVVVDWYRGATVG